MKAVVAAFNQEKALVGAFSVITNLRMELFEALPSVGSGDMVAGRGLAGDWGRAVSKLSHGAGYGYTGHLATHTHISAPRSCSPLQSEAQSGPSGHLVHPLSELTNILYLSALVILPLFGCESSPISRNVRSFVSSFLDKCKVRASKAQ